MKNPIVVLGLLLGGLLLCNCHPQKKVVINENPVGRSFDIVSMPGADSFTGGKPFLQFGAAGQLGGNTGCNGFFGEYKLQGNNLTLNIQGATKMYCMEVNEEGFFELMQKVESFTLAGGNMKLFGQGKELAILRERVEKK
jgi:heat shock protein HslJ